MCAADAHRDDRPGAEGARVTTRLRETCADAVAENRSVDEVARASGVVADGAAGGGRSGGRAAGRAGAEPHRGRISGPAWANRRLLLRGWERLYNRARDQQGDSHAASRGPSPVRVADRMAPAAMSRRRRRLEVVVVIALG